MDAALPRPLTRPHAPPAAADTAAAASAEDFRIGGAAERQALLEQLRDSAAAVLLHTAEGATLRTRLVRVQADAGRLAFAVAAGDLADLASPQLDAVLQADELTAVAHPGDVKLQFDLAGLVLVRGAAGAVLQAAWPDELLRFQRRETFRVCPPVTAPVAHLRHPAIPEMALTLRVLDLSIGGCALALPADVPALAPGTQLGGVTLELDLTTRLRVELSLQHVTHLPQPDQDDSPAGHDAGHPAGAARLGCEWRLVRPADERVLQRWIDQTQVRQRQRERAAAQRAASAPAPASGTPAGAAAS